MLKRKKSIRKRVSPLFPNAQIGKSPEPRGPEKLINPHYGMLAESSRPKVIIIVLFQRHTMFTRIREQF